jgi:uncharacterized small protein (DUF1192 family)
MAFEEERPRPLPAAHVIGQDLSVLSLDELAERTALLRAEIVRLEAAMAAKRASAAAADAVFRL